MSDRPLEELSHHEFQGMMGDLLSDDFDKVSPTEFFGALAAMDETESEVIELNARIEGGELVLDQPAALPVTGSEIRVNNKRIVIRLRDQPKPQQSPESISK